jgi:predicted RNA binding protein YcfA (HicA-like mRNA interferase family)
MSLRTLSYREVKRKLEFLGFEIISQKGSHVKYLLETSEGKRTVIVPENKEIAIGTLRSIVRQAGIAPEKFEEI